MGILRQFYGSTGVPLHVEADPHDVVTAWHSQRARLHGWLAELPDDDWDGPTRCEGWDVALLVRHLSSATQFLGYTLAAASDGTATTLLQGMDTRTTVASAAELLGDRPPTEARAFLAETDGQVDAALDRLGDGGLQATAEAPPGHMAAHLVLSHFLFDSWVHEYDLLVPRGEQPPVDPLEARVVVGYLIGLASIAADEPVPPRPTGRRPGPAHRGGRRPRDHDGHPGECPAGAAVVEGRAGDVVDRMTGRSGRTGRRRRPRTRAPRQVRPRAVDLRRPDGLDTATGWEASGPRRTGCRRRPAAGRAAHVPSARPCPRPPRRPPDRPWSAP